jgi:hypothetical protein
MASVKSAEFMSLATPYQKNSLKIEQKLAKFGARKAK